MPAGATISANYVTEYSTDTIEMHEAAIQPGQRVVLVDDLIATGGTLRAGLELVRKAGGQAIEAVCVVELPELGGRKQLDIAVHALISKADCL